MVWKNLKKIRKYSFNDKEEIQLSWRGQVDHIAIIKEGVVWKKQPIDKKQKSLSLNLPLGEYRLALIGNKMQSLRLPVQIWKAKTIQLVSPLPRNRERFGPLQFVWSGNSYFSSYQLEVRSKDQSKRHPSGINKIDIPFERDQNLEWGVWGIDQQGYKNPPRYYYPLFIRKNPFAPPKLKNPQLKPKKSPKTSWWHILVPKANAQTVDEALFSWEAIPGADLYFVEIAETESFRSPILKTQTKKNNFLWTLTNPQKKYFWRVAAGDQQGRMGEFSEAVSVEWQIIKPIRKKKPNKQVAPKKVPIKKPPKKVVTFEKVKPPQENITKPSEAARPDGDSLKWIDQFGFFWHPSYGVHDFKENGSTKASLSGLSVINLSNHVRWNLSPTWQADTLIQFSGNQYSPNPKESFPFQPDLTLNSISLAADITKKDSAIGYGLYFSQATDIQRVDFQEVQTQSFFSYGPMMRWNYSHPIFENQLRAALLFDNKRTGLAIDQRLFIKMGPQWLRTGLLLDIHYLGQSDSQFLSIEGALILGIVF